METALARLARRRRACTSASSSRATEGEESGNRLFVFNPTRAVGNDKAKEKVKEHAYGKDEVGSFNKSLDGFPIKVHAPKQAMRMHKALRELDGALPEDLDLGGWEEPEITAAKLELEAKLNEAETAEAAVLAAKAAATLP